jgi:energy-coupling factor transporter transmembrane protein EcfT
MSCSFFGFASMCLSSGLYLLLSCFLAFLLSCFLAFLLSCFLTLSLSFFLSSFLPSFSPLSSFLSSPLSFLLSFLLSVFPCSFLHSSKMVLSERYGLQRKQSLNSELSSFKKKRVPKTLKGLYPNKGVEMGSFCFTAYMLLPNSRPPL